MRRGGTEKVHVQITLSWPIYTDCDALVEVLWLLCLDLYAEPPQ